MASDGTGAGGRTYTVEEVAERYHVTRRCVYGWRERGLLVGHRPAGTRRRVYTEEELLAFERSGVGGRYTGGEP